MNDISLGRLKLVFVKLNNQPVIITSENLILEYVCFIHLIFLYIFYNRKIFVPCPVPVYIIYFFYNFKIINDKGFKLTYLTCLQILIDLC